MKFQIQESKKYSINNIQSENFISEFITKNNSNIKFLKEKYTLLAEKNNNLFAVLESNLNDLKNYYENTLNIIQKNSDLLIEKLKIDKEDLKKETDKINQKLEVQTAIVKDQNNKIEELIKKAEDEKNLIQEQFETIKLQIDSRYAMIERLELSQKKFFLWKLFDRFDNIWSFGLFATSLLLLTGATIYFYKTKFISKALSKIKESKKLNQEIINETKDCLSNQINMTPKIKETPKWALITGVATGSFMVLLRILKK